MIEPWHISFAILCGLAVVTLAKAIETGIRTMLNK